MGTKWYLFAKFYRHLSQGELMDLCTRLGFDGPTALVRDGYWVERGNMAKTLPPFVAEASRHGLEVRYADTDVVPTDAEDAVEQYRILAGEGIERVRMSYVQRDGDRDPRSLAEKGRRWAEAACELGARFSIQSVIQLHGGYYPQNATGVWPMVKGLDPRYVGVKIDPGNANHQEGFEYAPYQVNLLREYITAVGAKDACALRVGPEGDGKGWQKQFIPAYAGQTNFVELYRLLKAVGFSGPNVLMPFYFETDPDALTAALEKELRYLKDCWEKA